MLKVRQPRARHGVIAQQRHAVHLSVQKGESRRVRRADEQKRARIHILGKQVVAAAVHVGDDHLVRARVERARHGGVDLAR